ncbi:MAG: aminotransferase class I/II-fold pyridoxal phosphate-dependent enzyme [Candidatus Nanopelagicales bacterium]
MRTKPFEVLTPADLRRRTSLKWRRHGPDVLPLWVAEMDVLPAMEVVEAITEAVRLGDTGYPGNRRAYAEAFASFAELRWAWPVEPGHTQTCADVMTGIRALVELLSRPGEAVVIPTPVYPPFSALSRELGRAVVAVPLTATGRLDVAAIAAALAAGGPDGRPASVLLLCSPQNPTGVVHTAAELRAIADAADRCGATVVVDEVHAPLVPAGTTFVPWLRVGGAGFVVTSAAKSFNLAGLKAGLIIAGAESRRLLRDLPESVADGASHLGILGHVAALQADPSWLDSVNANIAVNRDLLASLVSHLLPDAGYRVPQATYLAWLDCRGLQLGDDPASEFLVRARVALTAGSPFGPGGLGHARLNLACSAAVLTEAVERMAAVVSRAGPGSPDK